MTTNENQNYDENTNITAKIKIMKLRYEKKVKYDSLETLRKNLDFENAQKLKNFV